MRSLPFLLVSVPLFLSSFASAEDTAEGVQFFEEKIRPVLVKHCYECHSADSKEVKGGLLLDTREGIQHGGESGHGVVPGNPKQSTILEALRYESFEMPPDGQLPERIIQDFQTWVMMGAPDPREGKSNLIKRTIDFDEARNFWAFQPITAPEIPTVRDEEWPATDIDQFVLARLEQEGLQPVGDAEPNLLVRRVFFDLTGLPPAPADVETFAADPSAAAYEELIDRLLDSPQFGERWGRHWLDVVRFAESTGMERNFTYPHAWRYRDYVINAFNADKPFDQFLREQVAGDLLPADNAQQRAEQLVATGMLAIGPKLLNETNDEAFQMEVVDDQIDVVSRAFLGLTASCARCHDHKFDPIPQSEYYALAGIFCSTGTHYGTVTQNGNRQPAELIALEGMQAGTVKVGNKSNDKNASPKDVSRQIANVEKKLKDLQKRKGKNAATDKQIAAAEKQLRNLRAQQKKSGDTTEDQGVADKRAGQPTAPAMLLMGTLDGPEVGDTRLRLRGEPRDYGDKIPRGFLTIATLSESPQLPDDRSGREQLADWLLEETNPLTARVAVNRIWLHLFGRGIVESVNNFGANGTLPSHPQLLDHLALQFRENGWSVKDMIRSIMLSRVYRLSTQDDSLGLEKNPDNTLLWRMNQRRLEVEAIRDAMLAASGQLDLAPMQGSVVATIGDGNVGQTIKQDRFDLESFKRSVYLPIVRGAVPEMLNIFDFPEPSIISGQREETIVPTQALFMMNSELVVGQSEQLARRLLDQDELDASGRVDQAFMLTLSRHPSASEIDAALDFISEAGRMSDSDMPETEKRLIGWTGFCQALLASAEFRYLD